MRIAPGAAGHPILTGLKGPYRVRKTLYRSRPLADSCTVLLVGTYVDGEGNDPRYRIAEGETLEEEPIAWANTYQGATVFYTSLGSARASFKEPWFRRMLINAIYEGLQRPVPAAVLN